MRAVAIVRSVLLALFLVGLLLGLGIGIVLALVELHAVDVSVHALVWATVASFGLCLPASLWAIGVNVAQACREAHID